MSLKSSREQIALEINLYGSDGRISSVVATKKIIEYLTATFPFEVSVPIDVVALTTVIKKYRNGAGLEGTVDEVIKTASVLASLDFIPEIDPFVFNGSGITVGQSPIWNTLPGLKQVYTLGELYLKSGLGVFNSFEFIECLGQDVETSLHIPLYNFIKNDVSKFESDANAICQRYYNTYTYTCRLDPVTFLPIFNVPNAPDFCIRAVS